MKNKSRNITKFPISYAERHKNILGPLAVECQVSGRYLQFHEKSAVLDTGEFISVDVMAMPDDGKPARKICGLVIKREDLLEALKHVTPSD